MGQEPQQKQEKQVLIAYLLMFLTIFSIVPMFIAYWLANKVVQSTEIEVWLGSHGFWIMRSLMIFICIALFSALWFVPLFFMVWNQHIWVTAFTVAGVVFASIAWLYLLNAWLKGIIRYFKHKPVY